MITIGLLLLPFVGALLSYLSGRKAAYFVSICSAMLSLFATIYAYNELQCGYTNTLEIDRLWLNIPKVFFHLHIDGLSLVMLGLTNILVPLILLSSYRDSERNGSAFYALILLMQVGLNGVFMAHDGLLFYLFWEVTLIPIYFIALRWGGVNRKSATMKFFAYTMFGSLFMLLAFIYLSFKGALRLEDLYLISLSDREQLIIFLAFFLAFAIKIPIFPLHTWQPATYTDSPTQGTMLLSGIMLKMGTYSLIRWLLPVVPVVVQEYQPIIITLSVIGVIYASIIAFRQTHIKTMIAYSSIAHVGLISAGIFSLTYVGLQGAVVQMVAHGINVIGMFLVADILIHRTRITDIYNMGGLRAQAPWFATAFLIVTLASVALPLTNAFVGEFMLLYGVWQYNSILGAVAGSSVILGAVYMFRLYQKTMLGERNNLLQPFQDIEAHEAFVFIIIIVLIFLLGVKPSIITDLSEPVIKNIVELSQSR